MSADNWAICPKCHKTNEEKLSENYGKLSKQEYDNLKKELEESAERNTLREDYEIGICDGGFEVNYNGNCDKCGFKYKYNFEDATLKNKEQ